VVVRPQRHGRNTSLMQIAAAVVGSSAAAQVIRHACRDDERETQMQAQTEQHTYLTEAPEGVTETPGQLDVVGANQRRLILRWEPDGSGVWIGGCLITNPADAEYLADFITREADE
jgi:hypothetical protein